MEREGRGSSKEDVMMRRIVKERVRRSKKRGLFSLEEEGELTHGVSVSLGNVNITLCGGTLVIFNILHLFLLCFFIVDCFIKSNTNKTQGKTIDESYKPSSTDFLSDSDDEDLDKIDTQLHFGGGKFDSRDGGEGAYGPSSSTGDLGTAYRTRREELEDRIKMKKMEKAERMKRREDQG